MVFHNELSFVFKELYLDSKCSYLCFRISFLMVFAKLLNVRLLEGSLILCQRERAMCFSAINAFIFVGKR